MQEEWKVVSGYDGRYEVSNLGRIRSYSNARWGNKAEAKIMKVKQIPVGYLQVNLYKPHGGGKADSGLIHRLVAEAFIPNPAKLPVVNHKDGNKTNNCADNLEWVTASENSFHAVRTGLKKPSQHQKEVVSKMQSIPVVMFSLDGRKIAVFESGKQAALAVGADISAVTKCCRGKLKKTKGYRFQYADG